LVCDALQGLYELTMALHDGNIGLYKADRKLKTTTVKVFE